MQKFELLTTITDLLRGKDAAVWHQILEKTLKHEDPYITRVSNVKILDVLGWEKIKPQNILDILQKRGCAIDERLVALFEQETHREEFSVIRALEPYRGCVIVEFQPDAFAVDYETYVPTTFGFSASICYQKVVDAALKYGFKQPDFITALYFRHHFWEAHQFTEGTRYYVGCKPLMYESNKPPIIPVLDYDRYNGWFLRAQDVAPDTFLNMNVGTGQGEHFESTFVFTLPQQ